MSVSVIIPAYKAARTVRRAVESACNQTSPPLEVLVINDGSPDAAETAEALQGAGPLVRLIDRKNGGAAAARNTGVAAAKGEWIAFLDADDFWEPNKLERQKEEVLARPDVAIFATAFWVQYPGQPRAIFPVGPYYGRVLRASGREAWDIAMNVWTGTIMVRREVLGDRPFQTGLETAEDRDLWVQLLASYRAYFLPDILATYVQYADSLSNSDPQRDFHSMRKVLYHHKKILGPVETRKVEAHLYRRWASVHLARGQYSLAVHPALGRLTKEPFSAEAWWVAAKASIGSQLSRRRSSSRGPSSNHR